MLIDINTKSDEQSMYFVLCQIYPYKQQKAWQSLCHGRYMWHKKEDLNV